jgi:hypothetical protein
MKGKARSAKQPVKATDGDLNNGGGYPPWQYLPVILKFCDSKGLPRIKNVIKKYEAERMHLRSKLDESSRINGILVQEIQRHRKVEALLKQAGINPKALLDTDKAFS